MATRADALVALKAQVDPQGEEEAVAEARARSRSSRRRVATRRGRFDVLDVDGQPMALTAVLTNADDIWQVDAAALAADAVDEVDPRRAQEGRDRAAGPRAASRRSIDGAKAAVEKFKKGLADQELWGDDLGSRTDAVVIGPATGDVTRGKSDIKKLWKKRIKANTRDHRRRRDHRGGHARRRARVGQRAGRAVRRRGRSAAAAPVRGVREGRRRLEDDRAARVARGRRAGRRRRTTARSRRRRSPKAEEAPKPAEAPRREAEKEEEERRKKHTDDD